LAQRGYRNAYVLSSNHQGYFGLKRYYEPFEFYLDRKDLDERRSSDDYLVLDGVDKLGRWDGRPTFLMLGLVSTHPLAIKHDKQRRYKPDRIGLGQSGDQYKQAYRNNYDNGIGRADDVIAKALQRLIANGYVKDDTIVAITSDHGESLGERGIFGHVRTLFNTELRIPIWIRYPGAEPRNTRLARQVDIAPTVVTALGVAPPESCAGRSLTSSDPGRVE
jgi:membrane-anchored protein YejM (alkaline phosphatase superfamily)